MCISIIIIVVVVIVVRLLFGKEERYGLENRVYFKLSDYV